MPVAVLLPRPPRRRVLAALAAGAALLAPPAPAQAAPAALAGAGCVSASPIEGCLADASLAGAADVALSAAGYHAYAAAPQANALTVLVRDARGGLSVAGCVSASGAGCSSGRALAGATAVDVSRDGRLVAVASPGSAGVAVFLRDPATGALAQPAGAAGCATETGGGACLDGRALTDARDVAFSPDGSRLYVASASPANAVAVLRTDPAIGITAQPAGAAGCFSENGTGGQCGDGWSLAGPTSVAATASGVLVTTSGSSSLVRLALHPGTGALSQTGCIREVGTGSCPDGRALHGAAAVAVTPDGATALVAAQSGDALSLIRLGATLSQPPGAAGCVSDSGTSGDCFDGRALDGANAVAVAPDGRTAYVTAGLSAAIAAIDVDAAGLTQATGPSGCTAAADPTCAPRPGLEGARGVAVDAAGRPVAAAETAGAVHGFRVTRAPSCTGTTTTATWEAPVIVPVDCGDPDGDPLTVRLGAVTRGADIRLDGARLIFTPRAGEETTLRAVVTATDGTLASSPATVIVRVTAPAPPPPVPPKPVPELPPALSAPLLGVERRPLDPRGPTTTLSTFCLPRRAMSCSGTVELRGGDTVLGQTEATGSGQVTIALAPAAQQALRRGAHARAISRATMPAGWTTAGASTDLLAIALPIRVPRPGVRRTGGQRSDRLRGGPGDDRISGRGSRDIITGLAGDDRLFGGGGNDRITGDTGHDDLSGSFGNDRLDGGPGDDVLRGASGDDVLHGRDDADRLDGGTGNDTLDGGPGDDVLDGFDGDDVLRGGEGDDYLVESRFGDDRLLDGGPGDDYVDGNRGNDRMVRGGAGNDIVLGGPGSDTVDGGPGDDVVDGGAGEDPAVRGGFGDDVLVGGRGNDTLEGGPGDDVLYGSTGLDSFDCGPGEDWAHVDSGTEARRAVGCEHIVRDDPTRDGAYDPVALVANRGLARGGPLALKRGSVLGDAPRPDRPIGTDEDDELIGTEARDLITGNAGNDLIVGLGGNDDLDGGDDDDELRCGDGRDRLFGRMGDDDIHGEGGDDELEGGRGRDTLDGGPGNDTLNGGFGEDVLRGGPGNDRLIAVGGGVDEVDCGPGRDRADIDRSDIVRNCEDVRRH